jgi:hypothetical protein
MSSWSQLVNVFSVELNSLVTLARRWSRSQARGTAQAYERAETVAMERHGRWIAASCVESLIDLQRQLFLRAQMKRVDQVATMSVHG